MKAVVEHISLFFHCMPGWKDCPKCGNKEPRWIATTSEYDHYCQDCDIRYTDKGEIYASS